MIEVKICGLCRPQDATAAAAAGADFLGVILAPGTRRSQSIESAAAILAGSGQVRRAGVFIDPHITEVRAAVEKLQLSVVQLHGDEPPDFVAAVAQHAQVWKAIRVRNAADMNRAARTYAGAAALLLDAYDARASGGTGSTLDWSALASERSAWPAGLPLVLAGGLTDGNVARAIAQLNPDIVDVSSGVEESLGRKSRELMRAFVHAARNGQTGSHES
jgi:phosphoribosylanthranilate isomerase